MFFFLIGAFTPPVNYYRAAFGGSKNSNEKKGNNIVQAPTLIIWGDRDVALHTDLAKMSATFCRQAQVNFQKIFVFEVFFYFSVKVKFQNFD